MSDNKKYLRITWVKSGICCKQPHRRTVKALGLRRLNHTVEREDNPAVRGMVNKISYLLKVEEVN